MPTYLFHGFRWHRANIRIHIIINNLEDAAPEWVLAPATSISLLNSFYTSYDFLPPSHPPTTLPIAESPKTPTPRLAPPAPPEMDVYTGVQNGGRVRTLHGKNTRSMMSLRLGRGRNREKENGMDFRNGEYNHGNRISVDEKLQRSRTSMTRSSTTSTKKTDKAPSFNDWSAVKLLEQYDPDDLYSVSQPYAYVADYMVEVRLGASILEEMAKYEARVRTEENQINSMPATPATPATPGLGISSAVEGNGPPLSARDLRRKSRRLGWFEKLRDGLQKGEDIGWFVIVCGDEERACTSLDERTSLDSEQSPKSPTSGTLRNFFHRRKNVPE